MADVAFPGQQRPAQSNGNILSGVTYSSASIEAVPNRTFAFPSLPPPGSEPAGSTRLSNRQRPKSMNMTALRPQATDSIHRRTSSTLPPTTLPSFTFNSTDTTGLQSDVPDMAQAQATPSRSGHRRNNSELVGGVGVSGAISSSPTRSSAMQVPLRRHRHGRSAALSSHDLSFIMNGPVEPQPRLSSSLPSTPLERPMELLGGNGIDSADPFGPALDSSLSRPPSRPRVEFSANVEYIPRPLSTISSETESSLSTVRGHSLNNSISSVLSLSAPSPPSSRARAISLETTLEDEPGIVPRSSLDIGKNGSREGEWLKHGSTTTRKTTRPVTEPSTDNGRLSFIIDNAPVKPRAPQKNRHSTSRSLGFDRRRSEPAIGANPGSLSRLSALSLQEPSSAAHVAVDESEVTYDLRSSTRRIKDWAVAKIIRKARPVSENPAPPNVAPRTITPVSKDPVAETDLDAVFSMDPEPNHDSTMQRRSYVEFEPAMMSHQRSFDRRTDDEEVGGMLDLDAALGPFRVPAGGSRRRIMHSSGRLDNFSGPGLHYQPSHERTLSAPILIPFEQGRTGTPPQLPMEDVFEEEEEEPARSSVPTQAGRRTNTHMETEEDEEGEEEGEESMGVEVVDRDDETHLGVSRRDLDAERTSASHSSRSPMLSTPLLNRRPSSIIEETIAEESSPVDGVSFDSVAIVPDHEEPRAQSLTKSSDSSETPTVLAVPTGLLALPDSQTSPETCHSSDFSSPDFARRQTSFEGSRVGTSASSITDNRTVSSCTTGEQAHDMRASVDDVPSLTSSRSTMISTMHVNNSRRDISGTRTPSVISAPLDPAFARERRRKRASIQSLSQLVGGSFGPRSDSSRPQTATALTSLGQAPKKKEHRLKKLMFWKSASKQRQASPLTGE